jgi:hypothetical protein
MRTPVNIGFRALPPLFLGRSLAVRVIATGQSAMPGKRGGQARRNKLAVYSLPYRCGRSRPGHGRRAPPPLSSAPRKPARHCGEPGAVRGDRHRAHRVVVGR